MNEEPCVYKRNGYQDRKDYLVCIAEDYGVELCNVNAIADMLGPTEDFDGLVAMVQDMEFMV